MMDWLNTNTQVFEITPEGPKYLKEVGVARIIWYDNPKHRGVKATVMLVSLMPEAKYLYEFEDPIDLEICYWEKGDRTNYETQVPIIGLDTCRRVGEVQMHNVVERAPDRADIPEVIVEVSCWLRMLD